MNSRKKPSAFSRFLLALGGAAGLVAVLALLLQGIEFLTGQKTDAAVIAIQDEQRNLLATLVALGSSNPSNEAERERIETEREQIESTIQAQNTVIATLRGTSSENPLSIQTPPPSSLETSTPTSALEAGVIFFDDFENGLDPAWQRVSGEWITNSGRAMVQSECGTLLIGEPEWNNIVVDINYTLVTSGPVYFIFSYQDEINYTKLGVESYGLYWDIVRDGDTLRVPGSEVWDIPYDRPHNLVIEINGNAIRGEIDDKLIYDLHFEEPLSGAVGFSACRRSNPHVFEDYKVSVLNP